MLLHTSYTEVGCKYNFYEHWETKQFARLALLQIHSVTLPSLLRRSGTHSVFRTDTDIHDIHCEAGSGCQKECSRE